MADHTKITFKRTFVWSAVIGIENIFTIYNYIEHTNLG